MLIYPLGLSTWGLPADGSCAWAGNSVVGMAMGPWSYAWLAGEFWRQPQVRGMGRGQGGGGGREGGGGGNKTGTVALRPMPPPKPSVLVWRSLELYGP